LEDYKEKSKNWENGIQTKEILGKYSDCITGKPLLSMYVPLGYSGKFI
jgi:hypothetical protein